MGVGMGDSAGGGKARREETGKGRVQGTRK